MIKLCFFWSYIRVFGPNRTMRWLCYAGSFVCIAFYVAELFHSIFVCIPVQKDYNPKIPGHCLPSRVGGSVTGIFNVITDMYIFVLPLPLIWSLQMELYAKLRIMLLFGLGALYDIPSHPTLLVSGSIPYWQIDQRVFANNNSQSPASMRLASPV